jgi:ligand-binding SRPBCC domain-containing protein
VLEREQFLAASPEQVFSFFADALNLEEITPPLLGFQVLTPKPIPMRIGTVIQYRLRLHGVPLRWLTSIQDWDAPRRFVDVQLKGPYALWHHTHEFTPAANGATSMRDTVRYALPFGALGELTHGLVKRDLCSIFDFRAEAVARLVSAERLKPDG